MVRKLSRYLLWLSLVCVLNFYVLGCGSSAHPHLIISLDASLDHLPQSQLVRRIDIDYRPHDQSLEPSHLELAMPNGVQAGSKYQGIELPSWQEGQRGRWSAHGRDQEGQLLLMGEAEGSGDESDVSLILKDALR